MLSIQIGCAIVATGFLITAALTFGVIIFHYTQHTNNSWPVDRFIICIFVALMVVVGILIFVAAYKESKILFLVALAVIVLLLVCWLVLTIFSFVNHPTDIRRLCIESRCSESFWLASLQYTTEHTDPTEDPYVLDGCTATEEPPPTMETTPDKKPTTPG